MVDTVCTFCNIPVVWVFGIIKCVQKKGDWAKYHNRHSSKSLWVTRLLFCQNDSLQGGSFWQKDSLITHILFELGMPNMIFSPVNFFVDTLYILYELFIHRKITIEIGVENLILKSLHTESQCVLCRWICEFGQKSYRISSDRN